MTCYIHIYVHNSCFYPLTWVIFIVKKGLEINKFKKTTHPSWLLTSMKSITSLTDIMLSAISLPGTQHVCSGEIIDDMTDFKRFANTLEIIL